MIEIEKRYTELSNIDNDKKSLSMFDIHTNKVQYGEDSRWEYKYTAVSQARVISASGNKTT